jgi:septal ring factor EnvC (AmiA/AmiB activator)
MYRDGIGDQRQKAASLQRDIAIMKNEISGLETQIQLTNRKIDKTKIEINGVQDTIFSTQEKIERQKDTIARLILFYNRIDSENLLQTMAKNDNLSEFFRQEQYASNVNQELINVVSNLKRDKESLEGNKDDLETKQTELELN